MKIIKKHIHPRLQEVLTEMYIKDQLKFYYHFFSIVNFYEAKFDMGTMFASIIEMRLAIGWTEEFVQDHSDKELKFVLIHEMMHLINKHLARGKNFDPQLSNIAMDMIINHVICKEHCGGSDPVAAIPVMTAEKAAKWKAQAEESLQKAIDFADRTGGTLDPKQVAERRSRIDKISSEVGKTYCVELDPNYKGDLIFEPLYEWLQKNKEQHQKGQPNELSDRTKELLDNMDQKGMTLDYHGELSELDQEIKDQIANEAVELAKVRSQKDRGTISAGIEEMLNLFMKEPKRNNLKLLKRKISNLKGRSKEKSYRRMPRRVAGLKGKIKEALEINAILDVSGSMTGSFDLVLKELFHTGYVINLIEADTQVQIVQKIRERKELKNLKIKGMGGTVLQPAVEYVLNPENKLHRYPTVMLTDGYCDTLNFGGTTNQFLILTTEKLVEYSGGSNVAQLKIEAP